MGAINLAQVIGDRSTLALGEDAAIFTCHWRETLAFQPDAVPMDHAARLTATNNLKTFLLAVQGFLSNTVFFKVVRWYDVPDAVPHKPVFLEELPLSAGIMGSASSALPPQVACSVTFRTDSRRQWGRFYLPSLTPSILAPVTGRINTTTVDAICTAARQLTDRTNLSLNHPTLTVWSKVQGTHHDPQTVEVDDVPDVIRSRRFSVPTYKKLIAAG